MNNEKQAILIMAHDNFFVLKALLCSIDSKFFDIFVHIDKKASSSYFSNLKKIELKNSELFFIENRINVKRGAFSQIKVELALFKAAANNNYEYYHLISGTDFLLQKPFTIYSFFHNNTKEFIHFDSNVFDKKFLYRVQKYHFFVSRKDEKIRYLLSKILLKMQFLKRNKNLCFQKGANWCSLTNEFVKYLINNEKAIYHIFSHTLCGDEMFVQTMAINSNFKNSIYLLDNLSDSNKRYIDWNRGSPYIFGIDDFERLVTSKMFFARKFADYKFAIVEKLIDYIK